MHAATFMRALAEKAPADVMIFDEALTSSPDITHYLPPTMPGQFFQTRGGSLGVGIPGGIGLKLAQPDRTVIAFAGDGGSMYTIQALWTAAHLQVGAKFIICNNRSYQLLKLNLQQYWLERDLPERDFPAAFDITNPEIQFVEMARSMGVDGVRVETPDQIGPAIDAMLADDRPYLIELVISSEVPGHEKHMKASQS
jgi:thiamine pyrophosphate-dependent acetolactate synthase large subunit-like protein